MKLILKIVGAASFLIASGIVWHLSAQSVVPKQDPKKGTWGYVSSSTDKWVVKPQYDKADGMRSMPNGKTRAFVTKKSKIGLVDENGKVLGAGVVFEDTVGMAGDAMMVTVKGKKGVINFDGQYLVKPEIEKLESLGQEGFLVTIKGKKGVLRHNGTFLIDPIYKNIDTSLPDWWIVDLGGKAGLLSRDGTKTLISPKEFTGLAPFGDLWKIYKGKKVGLYDLETQSVLVKPEYEDVRQPLYVSGNTLIPVADKPGSWGVVTPAGKKVVKNKFTDIVPLQSVGALLLYEGNLVKNIYFAGTKKPCKLLEYYTVQAGPYEVTHIVYDHNWTSHDLDLITLPNGRTVEGTIGNINTVSDKYYYLTNAPSTPLYDGKGNVVVPEAGNSIESYNGWTIVSDKAISPSGSIYDIMDDCRLMKINNKEYMAIRSEGKWGLFFGENQVLPCQYNSFTPVDGYDYKTDSSGTRLTVDRTRLIVVKDGKAGLFDPEARNMHLMPKYDTIYNREGNGDIFIFVGNGKGGIYDAKDKRFAIEDVACDSIVPYPNAMSKDIYKVYSAGKVGLCNSIEWIFPLSRGYNDIVYTGPYHDIFVARNGKYGVLDSEFKEIVPLLFDKIEKDGSLYICTAGGRKRYFMKDSGEISSTPRVVASVWCECGKTLGGDNASFLNFNLHFYFMKGREFTLYCDIYNRGKRVDQYYTSYQPNSRVYSVGDQYFTVTTRSLPGSRWCKEDFTVKFRLVDKKTGKEVPMKGNKTLSFWVRF